MKTYNELAEDNELPCVLVGFTDGEEITIQMQDNEDLKNQFESQSGFLHRRFKEWGIHEIEVNITNCKYICAIYLEETKNEGTDISNQSE